MKVLRHFLFVVLIGALAACSQQSAPQVSGGESRLLRIPESLQTQSTSFTAWLPSDGYLVEVLGEGMGSLNGAVSSQTVTITDPDTVEKVLVQVVVKGGTIGSTDLDEPTQVSITAGGITKTFTGGDLTKKYVTAAGGLTLTSGGQVYEGEFSGPVSQVEADITGIETDGKYTPRALIVYVFREATDELVSSGQTANVYIYSGNRSGDPEATPENFHEIEIDIPSSSVERTAEVTFAISEIDSTTNREVILSAAADGESAGPSTFTQPNEGDELLIESLTLTVPAGVDKITARVESPQYDGDSIYWNGVNVTVPVTPPPPPPPPGGGEGCTPGYWRQPQHFDSWDDSYDPDEPDGTTFKEVFDRSITVKTSIKGGKPHTKNDPTLLAAVWAKGGDVNALARHAVAALLNAANDDVSYAYSEEDVIKLVQEALDGDKDIETVKNLLATENEMGCPLN